MNTIAKLASHDPLWGAIRQAATALAHEEPILASLVHASVLNQSRFEDALNYILAQRLGSEDVPAMLLRQVFDAVVAGDADIGTAARADLSAVYERDPACSSPLEACYSIKVSTPSRHTGLRTLCSVKDAARWRSIFKGARRSFSASISTRRLRSVVAL
jgi:hypothetical protein